MGACRGAWKTCWLPRFEALNFNSNISDMEVFEIKQTKSKKKAAARV